MEAGYYHGKREEVDIYVDLKPSERDIINKLYASRGEQKRHYIETNYGVETWTTSDNPEVAKWLQKHVSQMHKAVRRGAFPLRHDPLMQALWWQHEQHKIDSRAHTLHNGIWVEHWGEDKCSADIVKNHAQVVGWNIQRGISEAYKTHRARCGAPPEHILRSYVGSY